MKRLFSISLCTVLVWIGATCGVAEAKGIGLTLTKNRLTKNRYAAPRSPHKQYQGTHYSPVKYNPRRYAWQRNLDKLTGYRPVLKPTRGTGRVRRRLVVKGASTLRRAANRRETVVRRRESRAARNRTVRSGFGTRNN